jgi:DNA-binding NarL/FixJ family response regulator
MKQSDQIKVLLVDDHAVVRSGLEPVLLCQDDMTLVGEAKNGAEAVSLCDKLQPMWSLWTW